MPIPTLTLAEHLGGVRIPTGDFAVESEIPNGRSFHVIGMGGGWHGSSVFNGTRFYPTRMNQPHIAKVSSDPPGGAGINSSFRDFAVMGKARDGLTSADDGLVLRQWNGLRIDGVGFRDLNRGLVLDPDTLKRAVCLHVANCQFANCDEAIRVDFSRTNTVAVLRLEKLLIATGCKVGITLADPFLFRTIIRDVYCEGMDLPGFAGFVQYKGDVIYDACYLEHGSKDIDGDRLVEPTMSIGLLGNSVARFRNMEKVSWLYVGPDAKFMVDDYTRERIFNVVFEPGDSRIDEWRQPIPGRLFRAHIAREPWEVGKAIEVERVKPIAA